MRLGIGSKDSTASNHNRCVVERRTSSLDQPYYNVRAERRERGEHNPKGVAIQRDGSAID
jgi:hypothetical protein